MKAVQYDHFGDLDVLEIRDVPRTPSRPGRVIVRVMTTSINPGEAAIREGLLAERWPSTFPSGQGSDLAGVVEEVGEGVTRFAPGDEVLGWTNERGSQAEYVSVPESQLTKKPAALSWEIAGSLFVAPLAGYASIDAVAPLPGETVVVAGATGGVGGVAAQLATLTGARTIGVASVRNHQWLRSREVVPVAYGEGLAERIREAASEDGGNGTVDAFVDAFGDGYVDLAVNELRVPPERVNTVIDFAAAQRLPGVKTEGSTQIASPEVIAELAALAAVGSVEIPIARTYRLEHVREAYRELALRHTRGKIVLVV
ncbi:MAG TPA: NADP-dependent oxidoreductase [Conexibacter sp.]|jgi:NADPH:quinone reductase-like Zn-dependent oxidoreductase